MGELIVILGLAGALMYFIYKAGEKSEEANVSKEKLDALSKSIEARSNIESDDDARRVLMEHAVRSMRNVQGSETDNK